MDDIQNKNRVFLVKFFKKQKLIDFCCQELEALSQMFGADLENFYCEKNPRDEIDVDKRPYVFINLPSLEAAQQI